MADLDQLKSALAANNAATIALSDVVAAESAEAKAKLDDLTAQIKILMNAKAGISAADADLLLASINSATGNLKNVTDAVNHIIPDAPVPVPEPTPVAVLLPAPIPSPFFPSSSPLILTPPAIPPTV